MPAEATMGRRLPLVLGTVMSIACAAGGALAQPAGGPDPASVADAVVAADGSGQFQSLQAAILAAPTATRERPWIIYVKAGTYHERLYVQREKRFLALVGEDASRTVVTFDLHAFLPGPDGRPISTFRTPTAQIDADDFTAENITFENPAGTEGRQALAVRVDGERVAFRGCRFVGWQDTVLLARGRQYFEGCFVSGSVDFIFGGSAAFFERSSIHARGDGYITAASTPQEQQHGFVFHGCRIIGEPGVTTWLGRPWRAFASVVFLDTEMSDVVRPEGWNNWDRPLREKTVRYGERGSSGPGASEGARVAWARRLTGEEASRLTVENIVGGADGWRPDAEGSVVARAMAARAAAPPFGETPRCPSPARFTPDVEYARPAGQSLRLDACVPPGRGPFPAAILVHGGGWSRGDRTSVARPLLEPLIRAGVAWLSVDYRLAPKHHYPAPVEDVEAAVRWAAAHARRLRIDSQRIALVGESAGGHLVAALAVRQAEGVRLAAVVPFFAPVDLEADAERRGGLSASLQGLIDRVALDEEARALLREASPIRHVRTGLPPFLLVHGSADMSVPYEQSPRFQKALREAGVSCDLVTIPDGTHGTSRWDDLAPGWSDEVVAWIVKALGGARSRDRGAG
jgi:pectinesterase